MERSMSRKIDVYWLRDGRLGAVFSDRRRPADATGIFDTVKEQGFPLDVVRIIDRDDIAYGELNA
jgi:hypothetical protein